MWHDGDVNKVYDNEGINLDTTLRGPPVYEVYDTALPDMMGITITLSVSSKTKFITIFVWSIHRALNYI